MKTIIVLATRNAGKTREIQKMLSGHPIDLKNLNDFGPIPEVEEDGATFDDNAYKKASFTARVLGLPAMADDSGLVVKALDGRPGVRSARYASDHASDQQNLEKVLSKLSGAKDRSAAFECVVSIAVPTGAALTYEGRCEGIILESPRGENGFGYDPVFFYPEFDKTFAEISMEEKSRVSHRGLAFKQIIDEMDKILDWIDIQMPVIEPFDCKG